MKSLTVAYVTSRHEPQVQWFLDSFASQLPSVDDYQVIVVDPYRKEHRSKNLIRVHPKPTVWQGPYRLTKADWWAASNARNTAICLCETDWIAFVDDRSVILPGWLTAVWSAMEGEYVVCGPYEKVHDLIVIGGAVQSFTKTDGQDCRLAYVSEHYLQHKNLSNPYEAPGEWTYGASLALPLEWALKVNGFDETCDGLRYEDVFFGMMLANNGLPIRYDVRMKIIEDRTPGHTGPVMLGVDKGNSPNDKSHWLVTKLKHQRKAIHQWDLRQVRASALAGKGFPVPEWPNRDPYDNQPLSEMTPC